MPNDIGVMNHRDCEPTDVVLEDSRSLKLTHRVLAERLTQVDAQKIKADADNGDYQYLASVLETGFRGYHNMGLKELMDEWHEQEETFYSLYEDESLLWELDEEDPLITLEQDENGEVETYGVPV
tara:strand:+ start:1309 stop:1683 length:375 start_codon:yes stop_codon:yes gene_type:complete